MKCVQCGEYVIGKKYCSAKCKRAFNRVLKPKIKKECVVCSAEFITNNPTKKTCSEKCSKENLRLTSVTYKRAEDRPIKTCGECGIEFTAYKISQLYCSHKCCKKVHERKIVESRQVTKNCDFCGCVFTTGIHEKRFCSPDCNKKFHKSEYGVVSCKRCGSMYYDRLSSEFCDHKCRVEYELLGSAICSVCGKKLTAKGKCLSCITKASHKKYRSKFEASYGNFKIEKSVTCVICGSEFITTSANAKYCSDDCRGHTLRSREETRLTKMYRRKIGGSPKSKKEFKVVIVEKYVKLGRSRDEILQVIELINKEFKWLQE